MTIYRSKKLTKDGRSYYYIAPYKDVNGIEKKRHSKKFLTRAEAIKAENDFIYELELYGYAIPVDMTFKQLFECYVEHQKKHVKPATWKTYKYDFKNFKSYYKIKVVDFTAESFEVWKKDFRENHDCSFSYKNNLIKFWKALLNYAMTWHGFRLEEEYSKIKFFVDNKTLVRRLNYYTEEQFLVYIAQEEDLLYRSFFKILYYCGLRVCEIRALSWKDINLRNHSLTIKHHYYVTDRKLSGKTYEITNPKFSCALRTITMHKSLCKDLNKLYSIVKSDPNFKKTHFVFGGEKPMTLQIAKIKNENNAINSDNKKISLSEFRHSCAYRIVKHGGNLITIAGFLGLSEMADAWDLYREILPVEMGNILNVINSLNKHK